MKKILTTALSILSILVFALTFSLSAPSAKAALVPYLSLIDNSGGQVIVTVSGADPSMSVMLYYPSASAYASTNIGSTNANGYLMTTINSATYNIAQNVPVYVMVNGQQSQQQTWPNYTSSGSLSLTQSNVSLSAGQSTVISASVSSVLSLSNNSNPTVASVNISGNQITVLGLAFGSSNITVCAANIGCATIAVSVSANSSTGASSVSFSQSNVSLAVGQLQQVTISGSGSYYISANSNSAIVTVSLSGTAISLSGISAGSATLSVCSTNSGSTTCGTLNVTVTGVALTNLTSNTPAATLSFSPSSVTMSTGQTQSVAILGGTTASTVYYVSNNTAPTIAMANVNGSTVVLTGIAFGGDNITICQSGGPCGNLYAYVSSMSTVNSTQNTTSASNVTPTLASFSVASNGITNFIKSGNVLTLTFSTNQSVNTPQVLIGGTQVSVTGSGSGPYSATYAVPVGVSLPLSVAITFTNPSGTGGQSYFWIGNTSLVTPANPTIGTTVSNTNTSNMFTLLLGLKSTGAEVKALQQRLKTDGFYTGPITGTFGSLTEAAVKKYQAKHGLKQVGVVGPGTRALLNKEI